MKAVALISGGIDSYTAAAKAACEGYDELYCLTFDYGQTHRQELKAAKAVARALKVKEHYILSISFPWGGSALIDPNIPIPEKSFNPKSIPSTYVSLRNHIFLNFAASLAEVKGIEVIVAGMNVLDYSGYPDCRPQYLNAQMEAWRWGTKKGVEEEKPPFKILTPLLKLSKGEIIRLGVSLGLDYSLTWSCYRGGPKACGVCDACFLRLKGFREAGIPDPLEYEA